MDRPTLFPPTRLADDLFALPAFFPIPPLGILPINAYLIRAREPILVDSGMPAVSEDFVRALQGLVDPAALRWIYLTHVDPDHIGSLARLLALAPDARLVTTYLGMGKLAVHQLPVDRVYLLNPGQTLRAGDRELRALRPPTYDAPETTAVFDPQSRTLFSADCFGALLQAPHEHAAAIPAAELRDGLVTWATVDVPWLPSTIPDHFKAALRAIRELAPHTILSAHLPPAIDMVDRLVELLATAPTAPPFRSPDQAELDRMLAG